MQFSRHSVSSLAVALLSMVTSNGSLAQDAKREGELRNRIRPLLEEHCLDCHSGAEPDAGLTLDHFDSPIDFLKGRDVWEHAVQKIQIKEMPPPDSSTLTAVDRKYLVDWITSTIDDFECGLTPNPGQVTLRRLNAIEYQNTIRDLFGLKEFRTASTLGGDDVGYGFDNIGDVLNLPPLLMEKYFLEAERISRGVIQTPPPAETLTEEKTGGQLRVEGQPASSDRDRILASAGVAEFNVQTRWPGPYTLTMTLSGDQMGSQKVMAGVEVDGRIQRRPIIVPNSREEPVEYTVKVPLRTGSHKIGIRFLNDAYDKATKADRNLIIHHVSLTGKKKSNQRLAERSLSDYHKRIITTTPEQEGGDAKLATAKVINGIACRAFRRRVEPQEIERLTNLALSVQEDGDSFEESIQVALQAILISPQFLFRVEPPPAGLSLQDYRDLDDFELATRLSYFLWSTMPDQELFAVAAQGQLRQNENLIKQVERMLRDKRAQSFVHNFAGQWLTLRKLRDFQPDPNVYPRWNDDIRKAAEYETKAFFFGVMKRNMSVLSLLEADFTYLNEDLAEYYGIDGVEGDHFRAVSLKGTQRAGLLTHASILAVTSNPTRTSPVQRGKWILENLLAMPPPPAPAGVPELEEKKQGELTGTLRERLEQHRADPACANCHKLMDPLGFALENFDAVGQYRTKDGNLNVDPIGELPGGIKVRGADDLRKILIKKHGDDFVECLTEKVLTYALGRGLEYYDKCTVDQIVEALRQDDYRFHTLIKQIVLSDPFQKKGEREIH